MEVKEINATATKAKRANLGKFEIAILFSFEIFLPVMVK